MYDIITIGSVTRDVFLKSDDFKVVEDKKFRTGRAGCFMLGAKFEVPDVAIASGGGGSNAAVTFARQGFKTGNIGRVGDDSTGREIQESLRGEGVEPIFQIDKERGTAYSTILVSADGERTILERRGANDFLNKDEVDWDNLKSKWVYIDSIAGDESLFKAILDWAKKNDVKVAMNPGKKLLKLGTELQSYLGGVDIFSANEDEFGIIAGIDYSEDKEEEIFSKVKGFARGIVVMTKGPKGLIASDGEKNYLAGIPDSPITDRTGAGDAFGSGFVSGYIHSDGDVEFAIQLGTSNATEVVQHFGAVKGTLKKGEWGDYPKVEVISKDI